MGYWQRKFHLKRILPDENIWKGFINIETDREEDLPDTVHGTYYVEKANGQWHGAFTLANGEKYDLRETPSKEFEPWVVTTIVERPPIQSPHCPASIEEATKMLEYLKPIECENVDKFKDNLNNCVYAVETHYWG